MLRSSTRASPSSPVLLLRPPRAGFGAPALLAALLLFSSGAAQAKQPASKAGRSSAKAAPAVKLSPAGARLLEPQLRPLPEVLLFGDFGTRLTEAWHATPVVATGGGSNHSEVGMNLFYELGFGYIVGPGHMGDATWSGGKVHLGDSAAGDRTAVGKSLLAERDRTGVQVTSPAHAGTFHTHPGDGPLSFSGGDLEMILRFSTSVTAVHALQGTGARANSVVVILVNPGTPLKAARAASLPELSPPQIAYLLDRAAPGRSAVYVGQGLTQELKRVVPSAGLLKPAVLKKIDALAAASTAKK